MTCICVRPRRGRGLVLSNRKLTYTATNKSWDKANCLGIFMFKSGYSTTPVNITSVKAKSYAPVSSQQKGNFPPLERG